MTGKVKWFSKDKGYGFIQPDGNHPDVFVHHTAIDGKGFKNLEADQRVEFRVESGDRGPKAVNVSVTETEDHDYHPGYSARP